MSGFEPAAWNNLRHSGLLLDTDRLRRVAGHCPEPLNWFYEQELRRKAIAVLDDGSDVSDFIRFVIEKICGFTDSTGKWHRGPQVGAEWSRRTITGQMIKPRHIWLGDSNSILPIFIDTENRLGIGRSRKVASQVLQWLRAGKERLALLTNGRQWRLIFAGLDFDAWCEWDVDLWFEEGGLSPQVSVLRTLISPTLWTQPDPNSNSPLLEAILDSRKGQAELSAVLGERIREAVEMLVQSHGEILKEKCGDVDPSEIYRAAVRVIMRMVVILFAESREMLPKDNVIYYGAYGISGLIEELEKAAARGANRLDRSWSGWPRMLALFRLVWHGSHHSEMPVTAYGGDLFDSGNPDSKEGLLRALHVFETGCFDREILSDRELLQILDKITRTKIKIRQGRSATWVPSPVDFSDLSSEYIGILYEGLLDFELKTAPAGDPVIFLAIGNQPALPLSRLEEMDDKALTNLLEKMKDTSKASDDSGESEDDSTDEDDQTIEESADSNDDEESDAEVVDEVADEDNDERHTTRTRAENWARRAVIAGKLLGQQKGKRKSDQQAAFEEAIARKARQLVVRVILPGEWYLVRWGGTRKGSGTFYTRPGLAVPTVARTLRPLAYAKSGGADLHNAVSEWIPKKPEEILALKVCDPACGSGTFPVAALRFLTEALYASLHYHNRIAPDGDRSIVAILSDQSAKNDDTEERLGQEMLPCRPDDSLFEPRMKAILRRYVVERCIYGVDLDPLAVELCRLALWLETMDRTLPFSFLDHKIKCGNGLIGAWFDTFQHYPVMAWKNREGGDKNHSNGVHFSKEMRTRAIKAFVKETLTPDLRDFLAGRNLFSEDLQEKAVNVHSEAMGILGRLHDLPVNDHAERARIYHEELLGSDAYRSLKAAMDLWCACWFWPADEVDLAPLPTTMSSPSDETRKLAEQISANKRFFHWELEFPDVFRTTGSGFDAVLGNPPWDTLQPNSKEFFSNIDPLYRAYGKQEALKHQTEYFEDVNIEIRWINYAADFSDYSNWMKFVSNPFGDPDKTSNQFNRFIIINGRDNDALHDRWRTVRLKSISYSTPDHPFRHRGEGKAYTYKLFLEQAYSILRSSGRLGFIVPSGLYSDHGTGNLRRLFLDHCRWEWLFGIENREGIFDIHRSYKFNPVIIQKGGHTDHINTAFMRRKLEDWERAEDFTTLYSRAQVDRFSPYSKAILEIQSQRDLDIIEKIYSNSVLLGDDSPNGWGIKYRQGDFNMTSDSKLFPPRPKWEADGYRPDEYSRWLKGKWRPIGELWAELGVNPLPEGERRCAQPPYDKLPIPRSKFPIGVIFSRNADAWIYESQIEESALPLYEGRMIGQFDMSQKGWISGKGRGAVWNQVPNNPIQIQPQYLMRSIDYYDRIAQISGITDKDFIVNSYFAHTISRGITIIDVTSSTNARTAIAAMAPAMPHGHSAPRLINSNQAIIAGILNSFVFDWCVRLKQSGLHLVWSVLEELPLPHKNNPALAWILQLSSRLSYSLPIMVIELLRTSKPENNNSPHFALRKAEKIRNQIMIDVMMAELQGIASDDFRWILKNCDHPIQQIRSDMKALFDPTGFWRVDKDKDPELRHTILALIAYEDLKEKIRSSGGDQQEGMKAFLNQNDGEGWMIPEKIRLADYGLGHDNRAKEHQPVASRLGPRFYDWQLAQSPEESWRECHLHARNMLGEEGYLKLLAEIESQKRGEPTALPQPDQINSEKAPQDQQRSLFD